MSETRAMHFVPRTYLKHFSIEESENAFFIHAFKKQSGEIIRTNIENICKKRDLYMLDGNTVEGRQLLENMYNDFFEVHYDNLYSILIDETRETLTMEERYDIISFVVSMFYRNNIWNVQFNSFIDEMLAKAYHASKQNDRDSFFFEEKELSIAGKSLEQLQKENKKQGTKMVALTGMQRIFKLTRMRILNDVVTVIKTSDNLVTSDNPVSFRAEKREQHPIPMDPANVLTLPIDSNHLLQLRSIGHEVNRTMIGRIPPSFDSYAYLVINNQYQHSQADRFVLGSESAIKSFSPIISNEEFKRKLREKMDQGEPFG